MILTTTQNLEHHTISEYLGVVFGQSIEKDEFGGDRRYLNILSEACSGALSQLGASASIMRADAVVGIRIDFEIVDAAHILVNATGTAVRIDRTY